jgi:DNA-binding CsgD family transcriptional regulator
MNYSHFRRPYTRIDSTSTPAGYALTRREKQVLSLGTQGLTSPKIAARLGLRPSTVTTHLKNAYKKLRVHNRTHAVAKILREGLGQSQFGPDAALDGLESKSLPLLGPRSPGADLPRNHSCDPLAASSAAGAAVLPPPTPLDFCPHCGSDLNLLFTRARLPPH